MVRLFPNWTLSFAPDAGIELDTLLGRIQWRGRAMLQSLSPMMGDDDPLPDPLPEPEREPAPPERKPHLPTPIDVPVPDFTDVPVPDFTDVPVPEPKGALGNKLFGVRR